MARSPLSITETLYHWMHRRRIESEVADEMDIPVASLSAKLSPTRTQMKLYADELVPLFKAIRKAGYTKELSGVVYRFICHLKGEELESVDDEDLVPQMFSLMQSMGMLAKVADGISRNTDAAELERMRTVLHTEVLPVVLQMENILASRIALLRPRRRVRMAKPKIALARVKP